MKSVFCRDMCVAICRVPAQTQHVGLRGERRGKEAGGVFAARLAETEQGGLCPDDFSARKRASWPSGVPTKAQRSGFCGERRSKGAHVAFTARWKRREADFAPTKCAAAGRSLSVGKGFAFFDGLARRGGKEGDGRGQKTQLPELSGLKKSEC